MILDPYPWSYPGSRYDIDFARKRVKGGYIAYGTTSGNAQTGNLMTCTIANAPANTFYQPNRAGILTTQTATTMRINDYGVWVESDNENFLLQCRDLTNAAWTLNNATATKTGVVGADATTGNASRLTATGANGTATQVITGLDAATSYIPSTYMKRNTGSGSVYITVDSTDTDVTSLLSSSIFTLVRAPAVTGATSYTFGVKAATSGDVVDYDFGQFEDMISGVDQPSSRILTTSASQSRGPELATFNTTASSANFNDGFRLMNDIYTGHPMSFLVVMSGYGVPGNDVLLSVTGVITCTGGNDGGPVTFNNATTANSGNQGVGNWNRIAGTMDAKNSRICLNGGAIATHSGGFSNTVCNHGSIGNRGAGDLAMGGPCARITYWKDMILTDAQMQAWTVSNPYHP